MDKLDLVKLNKAYFNAKAKPELVEIAPAKYLSIRGKGDPSEAAFAEKIQALYATAYVLKFIYKALGQDFVVSKLEGLWWYDERRYQGRSISDAAVNVPRSEWEYRLLIMMPAYVKQLELDTAIHTAVNKKQVWLAEDVHLFEMNEGSCVQMLHKGAYDTEPETLEAIMAFCTEHKLGRNGLHHEIYLSDFRRTEPSKLKTILREPVILKL